MGSVFRNLAKHGVVGSSALKATRAGHIYNIQADKDMDNGSIVAKGDYAASDFYKAKDSTGFSGKIESISPTGKFIVRVEEPGDALLVATTPTILEAGTKGQQAEYYFYNAKDEIMRCYELYKGDRFEVSKECLGGVSPTVGGTVAVTSRQLTVS